MKKYLIINVAFLLLSCGDKQKISSAELTTNVNMKMKISKEKALEIAELDAKTVYQDLSIYTISVSLKGQCWEIDYELTDTNLRGGGPHYSISQDTGEILSKRYEQ